MGRCLSSECSSRETLPMAAETCHFLTKLTPLSLGLQIKLKKKRKILHILLLSCCKNIIKKSSKLCNCFLTIPLKLDCISEFKASARYCIPLCFLQCLSKLDILLTCFSRSLMGVLNKVGPSTNSWGPPLDTCSNLRSTIYHYLCLLLFSQPVLGLKTDSPWFLVKLTVWMYSHC